MMTREELFTKAFETQQLPPVYVRSHARADKLDTFRRFPFLVSHATLVVAEDEELDYRLEWPDANIRTIPSYYAGEKSSGRAIQWILDLAVSAAHEHIFILDDDLMSITALYGDEEGNVSRAVRRHLPNRVDRDRLNRGFFGLIALAAEEAYAAEPTAALAGVQVMSPAWTANCATVMWRLNFGPVFPSQLMSVHVPRFTDHVDRVDPDFHEHGDDLSMTVDLLDAGGSTVMLPTFITGWRSYETESVIRDELTAPAYRQREHDLIMAKPLGQQGYIRTRYDDQGRPWWHRVNWQKLRKDGKVKTSEKTWKEGLVFPESLL